MSSSSYSPLYKIILVGDSGVGKTCLLSVYTKGTFEETLPTIALEFCTKDITLEDNSVVKAQLWDTAGQERFKSLVLTYYRKAFGILLLFDVTKRSTFESCASYIENVRLNSDKNCVVYLLGNKIDLESERQVKKYEAEEFAKKQGIKYIETSAIKNINVSDAFISLLNDVHKTRKNVQPLLAIESPVNMELEKKRQEKGRKNTDESGCC